MINITDTIDFYIKENTVVTIGKFDGIHKGHERILQELCAKKKEGLKTVVFTFDTPPNSIFFKEDAKVLTTNAEKRELFEAFGIDYLIEFPFHEKTAAISAESFIENILLDRLHMKTIVVGVDCRFGHKGNGNGSMLQKFGMMNDYETVIIEKALFKGQEISSTLIRDEVKFGSIAAANEMLIYPYTIFGEVVHGRKFGRTIGMPTVNLVPEKVKLLPPNGVYLSTVCYNNHVYESITNIGCKPTVGGDIQNGVETYIYDFDQNVYGDFIAVSLLEFQRSEMKFPSVEELKFQMQEDIKNGKKWHEAHKKKQGDEGQGCI